MNREKREKLKGRGDKDRMKEKREEEERWKE